MLTDRINIKTVSKKTLGDLHTPMNIYLKIRDKFRIPSFWKVQIQKVLITTFLLLQ